MSATLQHIDPETGLDTTSVQAMTRGEKFVYHPDPFRAHLVSRAASVMERFNSERDENVRAEIMRGFFKNHSGQDKPAWLIVAPFFCEYVSGCSTHKWRGLTWRVGFRGSISAWVQRCLSEPARRFSTPVPVRACLPRRTLADTHTVTIGSRTLIGPNVSIYTPFHPVSPEERNGFRGHQSQGRPVVIGEDCWIGGSVTILPGVTIGRGSTIGAGSVVVKDIPARSVAVGNPARVVRAIPLPE